MPTYEYACEVCGNQFEIFQKITDEKGTDCPKCRVFTRNRLISTGTKFVLVGKGWAADNYSNLD